MNTRQKSLTKKIILVIVLTFIFISAMTCYKDIVNKNEAMKSCNIVSSKIAEYKSTVGSLPPIDFVNNLIHNLGLVRIGNVEYRARWMEPDSPEDSILLFSKKDYRTLLVKPGYVVLTLKDIHESQKIIELKVSKKKLLKDLDDTKSIIHKETLNKEIAKVEQEIQKAVEIGCDGSCEWMPKDTFESIYKSQQKKAEAEILLQQHEKTL